MAADQSADQQAKVGKARKLSRPHLGPVDLGGLAARRPHGAWSPRRSGRSRGPRRSWWRGVSRCDAHAVTDCHGMGYHIVARRGGGDASSSQCPACCRRHSRTRCR